jgi:hypothetical protein
MLLTNEEVVEILDDRLDYSDFGDWSGDEDDLIEFAYYVVKAENEKRGNCYAYKVKETNRYHRP